MLSKIKVSAITIGSSGDYQNKLALALDHLKTSGEFEVDMACLPEIFAGNNPEPIPSPTPTRLLNLLNDTECMLFVQSWRMGRISNTIQRFLSVEKVKLLVAIAKCLFSGEKTFRPVEMGLNILKPILVEYVS